MDAVHRQEASRPVESSDSIALSLSIIGMMFQTARLGVADDPVRRRDEEATRAVWARLRRVSGVGR
jgi:hypothetical protein